jgi:2-phospho-L-lactate guanylyltransferase
MNFLVPFKGLRGAKSRWKVGSSERQSVVLKLLRHNLQKIAEVVGPQRVHLVTPEPALGDLFPSLSLLHTATGSLNSDLEQARTFLTCEEPLAVLLPDLPHLNNRDIEVLIEHSHICSVLLCPDFQDIGTNAVVFSPADCLEFLFEGASFERYRRSAGARRLDVAILRRPGLAHDCDELVGEQLAPLKKATSG